MSLKAHIVVGTLLGVLLGVVAVTVLSRTASLASSAEASEPGHNDRPEDAVSPAALRSEVLTGDFSRSMRPGALRRSLQS